jgi:opacity protein-like surface antigen
MNVNWMLNLNGTIMKQSAKIATIAIALFTGISGTALANGTNMQPPAAPAPAPAPPPASESFMEPPATPARTHSSTGPYISGAAGVGIPEHDGIRTGYALNGAVGYNYDPARAEFAIGYQRHDLKHVSGHLSYWTFMANAYYDFEMGSGVKPYVMGGLGAATVDSSWLGDNDTDFAWQLGAGLGFKIDESTTFDLGYRYLRPENGDTNFKSHNIMAGIRYQF